MDPSRPTLDAVAERPHNLRAQPTPLLGRERELRAVCALIARDDVRLLTLTGPPGTGKTRLAQAVAAELVGSLAHGARSVGLETVREVDEVIEAIAQSLQVHEIAGRAPAAGLTDFLTGRHLLAVLDNCEQVLDAGVQIAELRADCPRLKVLATSRSPLRVRWEHEYPVPPLALPSAGIAAKKPSHGAANRPPAAADTLRTIATAPAVQLFVRRAQAVDPAFRLSEANAATIAAICARLEGLPLAIERAAARVKLAPLEVIRERLQHRLPFLTGGPRDLPARQRRYAPRWPGATTSSPRMERRSSPSTLIRRGRRPAASARVSRGSLNHCAGSTGTSRGGHPPRLSPFSTRRSRQPPRATRSIAGRSWAGLLQTSPITAGAPQNLG